MKTLIYTYINVQQLDGAILLVIFVGRSKCVRFHWIPRYCIRTILQCHLQ